MDKYWNVKRSILIVMILCAAIICGILPLKAQAKQEQNMPAFDKIEEKVGEWMDEGDIPGLSLIFVNGDDTFIKSFGYADVEKEIPVTGDTLFELCSTSKAFTALAALKLEQDGLIDLDAPVSKYLPWFYTVYEGKKQKITLKQCLHQTSGMPFSSVSRIPASGEKDALQKTVKNIAGIELDDSPGKRYRYATVNYDIIGAVIEKVSGQSYETYITQHILHPSGLHNTYAGRSQLQSKEVATGYKIGFFKARKYHAPVFRGNTPAGYIISNGNDIARWLKLQIGSPENPLTPLIKKTQQRDRTVPADGANQLSYAMGWMESLDGSANIMHPGMNPNFSAYIVFNPEKRTGVAVLANSNSSYTAYIGRSIINMLHGEPVLPPVNLGDAVDKGASILSLMALLYLLCVVAFLVFIITGIAKGTRKFEGLSLAKAGKIAGIPILLAPFLGAIYFLPYMLAGVPWKTALVWSPISLKTAMMLIVIAMAGSYLIYIIASFFPHRNKYIKAAPFLILLSVLSGSANAVVIFLITMSLQAAFKLEYLLFYFLLAMLLYLLGRKNLQVRLVRITFDIIYDLRLKLVNRIFGTSYQKFEKLDRGRILATLNNDTAQLGNAAAMFVQVASSLITIVGAFMYLAAVAFWATIVTIVVIFSVATIYSVVTGKANALFNIARDTQNEYMGILTGMNDGFKELSLHSAKKKAYSSDVRGICARFRDVSSNAMVKFVNAFMVGESMLIVVLGAVGFGIPVILPHLPKPILMSFIMVLLYLIGPVTGILNAIPGAVQVRIAYNRVQELIKDIPSNIPLAEKENVVTQVPEVDKITVKGVYFEYETEEESETFSVGPIDLEAEKGEIIFIIGGNGSGKTTLAKLLTGLYIPSEGEITINGEAVSSNRLGEYFSIVFGDYHLFEKLYDVELTGKEEKVQKYLEMLRLKEKVKIEDNAFSTIDLSGGQRKRLALLRCYLEDRPIYLFDEVAADQDPGFRKFFYRDLLKEMKEEGKIVIAVTHDDHYFDAADRVIKLDMGKIDQTVDAAKLKVTG